MRLKTFFWTLKNSLTLPTSYLAMMRAPFSFSWRYFLMSMVLIGLITAIRINQRILPNYKDKFQTGIDEAVAIFPSNLEIRWQDNRFQISPSQPLQIPYPSQFNSNQKLTGFLAYMVPQKITVEEVAVLDQDSLIVISEETFFINTLQGSWAQAPLTELLTAEELIINQKNIPQLAQQLKDQLDLTTKFIQKANFFLVPIILLMIKLITAIAESLFLFLFFKLNNLKINFVKTLKLSLQLVVTAELINQVGAWIYPNLQIALFTLSYWVIFSYIFWTQKGKFSQL